MNCDKCGKKISLFDINSYKFISENEQLEVRCLICGGHHSKENVYPIGMILLIIASFLLISFFIFNLLIIGFFTIFFAIVSIVSQFYFVEKRMV